MRPAARSLALTLAMAVAAALASAGSAGAYGYCGVDQNGPTACPVSTNETLSGSISGVSEHDYYVFYVAHQTNLVVTVDDTENPDCSIATPGQTYGCGWVEASLLDSRGNDLADTDESSPDNGIPVPESLSKTVGRGTYYVTVSGFAPGPDSAIPTLPTIPYEVTVDGSPPVRWPPACIVPRLRSHTRLGRAKSLIRDHRCTVGRVRYVSGSRTPAGDVIRLRPGAGSVLPYAAPVTIYVSGHRPRHRHHRR